MASEEYQDIVESDFTNGLIIFGNFLPEEVMSNILHCLSWDDLLNFRLVCHSWKRLIDSFVSYKKIKECKSYKACFAFNVKGFNPESLPFYVYYAIGKNAFGSNHLKNAFGSGEIPHVCQPPRRSFGRRRAQDLRMCSDVNCPRFKHWSVLSSQGDGWTVEMVPQGSQPLPEHLEGSSCFVTSYGLCSKQQIIKLSECGLSSKIMDEIQPHIDISEWYARRFDCGSIYRLKVSLLDINKEVVDQFIEEIVDNHWDDNWHQVSHTFRNYGPDVRFLLFHHEGIDTQFWAGYYGSKMAGGSVIARIPEDILQLDDEPCQGMNND
uniref:F-box domain-containing protein n=1 Tax=Homalodisca liturata TaxID=320908 RepID=A0A1B6J9E4_9HEMI